VVTNTTPGFIATDVCIDLRAEELLQLSALRLRKIPPQVRGFVGGFGRRTAPDSFTPAVSDCCRIDEAHPRQPLQEVRRSQLGLDFNRDFENQTRP